MGTVVTQILTDRQTNQWDTAVTDIDRQTDKPAGAAVTQILIDRQTNRRVQLSHIYRQTNQWIQRPHRY